MSGGGDNLIGKLDVGGVVVSLASIEEVENSVLGKGFAEDGREERTIFSPSKLWLLRTLLRTRLGVLSSPVLFAFLGVRISSWPDISCFHSKISAAYEEEEEEESVATTTTMIDASDGTTRIHEKELDFALKKDEGRSNSIQQKST